MSFVGARGGLVGVSRAHLLAEALFPPLPPPRHLHRGRAHGEGVIN